MVLLCAANNILLYTDSPTDIADCIDNIGSCLRKISSNVNLFIFGLILPFIDQSNGWTLPNGSLSLSLFFRDSLHLIENENVNLVKFIINSYNKQFICFVKCIHVKILVKIPTVYFVLTLNEADFHPLSPQFHAL